MRAYVVLTAFLVVCGCKDDVPPRPPPPPIDGPDAGGPVGTVDGGLPLGPGDFDPTHVYLLGTLSETECQPAVIDLEAPELGPEVGFDCDSEWHTVRGSDGNLVYLHEDRSVRAFRADDGSAGYPVGASGNDPRLSTSRCDSVGGFAIVPDSGQLIYTCGTGWFEGDSRYDIPAGYSDFLPGFDGYSMLIENDTGVLGVGRGTEFVGSSGMTVGPIAIVRPQTGGFEILTLSQELYFLDDEGSLEMLGTFDTEGLGVSGCVLDHMQRALCLTGDSVVRLSLGGAPTTVFTSGDQGVHIDSDSWLIVI